MNHRIVVDPRAARWEHETAMLASSMMLVSISEESPTENVGFKSRICASPRIGSGSSLSGWGSAATRKSCKMDLCALAGGQEEVSASPSAAPCKQPPAAMRRAINPSEGWGFYTGDDVYSRQR